MRLSIPDMACGGCAAGVRRAIAELDERATVSADPPSREAVIETKASEADVLEALQKAGFPAEVR
ncbi:heavy-metal-associated domain-containing protein [Acuticoccus sp. MNP-M23]|uniref:heavy-metal-associated domain-containing protein n=1 Tax=Acuticoccus sp. MNP-M23 TaxID=3072793 RepID=UPI0028163466|nr:heavy-metal-associated domain-containing protein [Acuticoccus sp. MNP-M23]WMS44401.1 heavy-metal-associated domain-containing protein [Acuticoccus sp. MNP-M23]